MAGPLWQCLFCDGPSNLEVVDELKSYFESCKKKKKLQCKRSVISIVEKEILVIIMWFVVSTKQCPNL